jgi:hypothetical protein
VTEIAQGAGLARYAVQRELRALVAGGLIRRDDRLIGPSPRYAAERSFPGSLELWRFVAATSGAASRIRAAILAADPTGLAWIHGPYTEGRWSRTVAVVVLTASVRRVTRALEQMREGTRIDATVLTPAQWTLRLEQRELVATRLRKAQKLWLLGDPEALRWEERTQIDSRRTWKAVLENWREEFLWDETLDEFGQPIPTA